MPGVPEYWHHHVLPCQFCRLPRWQKSDSGLKDRLRAFCRHRLKVAIAERRLAEVRGNPHPSRIDETLLALAEHEHEDAVARCDEAFNSIRWQQRNVMR